MEAIIENFSSNPLYMIIGIVLVIVIIFSILKKLFKIAVLITFLALIYVGYLYMTDPDPGKTIQKQLDKGKSAVEELERSVKDVQDIIKNTKKKPAIRKPSLKKLDKTARDMRSKAFKNIQKKIESTKEGLPTER